MASVELILAGIKQGKTVVALREFCNTKNAWFFSTEMKEYGIEELIEIEGLPSLTKEQIARLLETPYLDNSFSSICIVIEDRGIRDTTIVIDGYGVTDTHTLLDIKEVARNFNLDLKITVQASMNAPREIQRVFL